MTLAIIEFIGNVLLFYLAYTGVFIAWRARAYVAMFLSLFLDVCLGIGLCRDVLNGSPLAYVVVFGSELALTPFFYMINLAKRNRDGN